MKTIIAALITLGLAVGFASLALEDPGYVVLSRAPYTVRLPLALFALFAALGFLLLYWFFNLLGALLRAPKRFAKWRLRRNQTNAQIFTMRGYAKLIEGDWASAERKLLNLLPHNKAPLLNYLGAAYAAQQLGNARARDRYLADALLRHPAHRTAIRLTQARLHFYAGELVQARDALEKLRARAPNNIAAGRLLAEVYRQLADWHSLAKLLPLLVRIKAFPPHQLATWEQLAARHFWASPALLQGDGNRPTQTFNALSAKQRKKPQQIAGYCRLLIDCGKHATAEKTLRRALNRGYHAELAALYGRVETAFTNDQIALVKSWLKKYGEHADLKLAVARLCRRARRFDEAREFFAAVINEDGRADAHLELGELLDAIGDVDAAMRRYRQAITALAPNASRRDAARAGQLLEQDASGEVIPAVK